MGNLFERPLTEEELQQLLRERAERLDPANRPPNAEVDNAVRDWDYDLGDFRDSLVDGRPREIEDGSKHVAPIERPSSLRLLGTGLVLVCAFFLWLTWAFFSQTFTEYDEVKLVSNKSGLAIGRLADVKLRGMIVGQVREIKAEDGNVVMTLAMDPELIDRVPADVRAEIVPKTLFGEKYVSLVPVGRTTESLRAGDTITDTVVPVEFEEFFNDVYPLLTAVPPEKVSYTLTALANTLEGRGDSLGATLDRSNDYLRKLNPETQRAVADIVALGEVSQKYSGQMEDLGQLLDNAAELNRTIVDVDDNLEDFVDETDGLATTLATFVDAVDDDLVGTVSNSVQPLTISEKYSPVFPCWFQGLDLYLRSTMDSILKNKVLHIDLTMVPTQATQYDIATERPTIPTQAEFDAEPLTDPNVHGYTADGDWKGLGTVCDELKQFVATGQPVYTHENPRQDRAEWWQFWGIRNSHNGKLGADADYNRPAPAAVPDVAHLLVDPVVAGAEWELARK